MQPLSLIHTFWRLNQAEKGECWIQKQKDFFSNAYFLDFGD